MTETCSSCGCESAADPCTRCESEMHWAGSDRATVNHEQRIHERRYDLTEALTFLPEEYAQLPLFRLPGSGTGDGAKRTHPGSRPPLNVAVLDLTDTREKPDCDPARTVEEIKRDRRQWRWDDEDARRYQRLVAVTEPASRRQGVLPTLTQWVRLVDSEMWDAGVEHADPAESPTVSGECSWLLGHVDWIIQQRWADEIVKDAQRMRADVRRAIGDVDPPPLDCLRCGNPVAKIVVNGNEDAAYWKCTASGCDAQWSRLELHKLELAQRPKTLAQIAPMIERSLRTLQDWAIRKPKRPPLIYPKGRDARGEKTYSLSEVRKVALMVPGERKRKSA